MFEIPRVHSHSPPNSVPCSYTLTFYLHLCFPVSTPFTSFNLSHSSYLFLWKYRVSSQWTHVYSQSWHFPIQSQTGMKTTMSHTYHLCCAFGCNIRVKYCVITSILSRSRGSGRDILPGSWVWSTPVPCTDTGANGNWIGGGGTVACVCSWCTLLRGDVEDDNDCTRYIHNITQKWYWK